MKKKLWLTLTVCAGIVIILLFYTVGGTEKTDKGKINALFEKNISKITIRQAADLPQYIEFSDADMVNDVKKFFKEIKINDVCKPANNINGGGYVINALFEDGSKLSIVLREKEIAINGATYQIEPIGTQELFKIYRKGVDKGYLKKIRSEI